MSPLLSDADLTSMRTTANTALPGTAVIQSRTFTDDAGGGGTSAWAAAGTVSCRVAPVRGDERIAGERVALEADWIITLPAQTSITEASRIVSNGGTFEPVDVPQFRSWELTRRVLAKEVV